MNALTIASSLSPAVTSKLSDKDLDQYIVVVEAASKASPGTLSAPLKAALAMLQQEKARRSGGGVNTTTILLVGGGLVAAYLLFIRK